MNSQAGGRSRWVGSIAENAANQAIAHVKSMIEDQETAEGKMTRLANRPDAAESGARGACSKLLTDDRRDLGSQNLYRSQHFGMRKRRDPHLKRDAGESSEGFIHVK